MRVIQKRLIDIHYLMKMMLSISAASLPGHHLILPRRLPQLLRQMDDAAAEENHILDVLGQGGWKVARLRTDPKETSQLVS